MTSSNGLRISVSVNVTVWVLNLEFCSTSYPNTRRTIRAIKFERILWKIAIRVV